MPNKTRNIALSYGAKSISISYLNHLGVTHDCNGRTDDEERQYITVDAPESYVAWRKTVKMRRMRFTP